MKNFTTQTDVSYAKNKFRIRQLFVLLFFTVACLFLLIFGKLLWVIMEALILLAVGGSFALQNNKYGYTLRFEGDELYITNQVTGEAANIYAVPPSDFIIHQNGKEKDLNYGTLKIKHTNFTEISGVQNVREMKAYILKNFAKYG